MIRKVEFGGGMAVLLDALKKRRDRVGIREDAETPTVPQKTKATDAREGTDAEGR